MQSSVELRTSTRDIIIKFNNECWCIDIPKGGNSTEWEKLLSRIEDEDHDEQDGIYVSAGEDSYWFLSAKSGKIVLDINIYDEKNLRSHYFSRKYEYSVMIPLFKKVIEEIKKYEAGLKDGKKGNSISFGDLISVYQELYPFAI